MRNSRIRSVQVEAVELGAVKMALLQTVLFIILSLCFGCGHSADYGARLRVTAPALAYVNKVAIPQLSKLALESKIKDVSGSSDTPVGRVDYEITGIIITAASIRESSFKPVSGIGLQLSGSGIYVAASAHWHYKRRHWPHISDSGSVAISAQDVSFELAVAMGADQSTGRPTMEPNKCISDVGRVIVKFHGGASWLYNLFSHSIASVIKDKLKDLICNAADKYIRGNLAVELGKMKVTHKLDQWAILNYKLTEQPYSSKDYIDFFVKSEVEPIDRPYKPKFEPSPIPPSPSYSSKMVYFWITDYLPKTAADVYSQAGMMHGELYPDMIPKDVPFQLNTSAFRIFIPKLYNLYPNQAMMLKVHVDEPPKANIEESGINASAIVIIDVYVTPEKKQPVLVFSIITRLETVVTLGLKCERLVGEAKFLSLTVLKMKSNIGDIKTSEPFFKRGIELLGKRALIKKVNTYLGKGFPLPKVKNVQFINTEIKLGKNYVLVDSDLRYVPDLERVRQAAAYAAFKEKFLATQDGTIDDPISYLRC